MNELRIVITGGLSGGHTTPLIAVARSLRRLSPAGVEILFVGSHGKIETDAMNLERIPTKFILYGKYRRYFSFLNLLDVFRLPIGFVQALWYLTAFMPDAVFAKGGAVSVPVVLAARLLRIPVMIHDSDAAAGKATRLLGKFAQRVAITYPQAAKYFPPDRTVLTGNPLRPEILAGNVARASTRFGFMEGKPVLFVMGGSLGARAINAGIVRILPQLLKAGIQVLHQTGVDHIDAVKAAAAEMGVDPGDPGYRAYPYLSVEELADAYALADVVMSRAGSTSISELAATRKAVILVPLSTAANDEQRENAYAVAEIGGAMVVEDENLIEHLILEKIAQLFNNEGLRKEMGEKLSAFYHPDAADHIATGIIALATKTS